MNEKTNLLRRINFVGNNRNGTNICEFWRTSPEGESFRMRTFGRPCFAKSKHRLSENGVFRQSQPSAEALCYAFRPSAKIASRSLFLAVSSIFFCSNSFSLKYWSQIISAIRFFICSVPCIKTLLSGLSNIYSQVLSFQFSTQVNFYAQDPLVWIRNERVLYPW